MVFNARAWLLIREKTYFLITIEPNYLFWRKKSKPDYSSWKKKCLILQKKKVCVQIHTYTCLPFQNNMITFSTNFFFFHFISTKWKFFEVLHVSLLLLNHQTVRKLMQQSLKSHQKCFDIEISRSAHVERPCIIRISLPYIPQ